MAEYNEPLRNSAYIKRKSKEQLKGKWGIVILLYFIYGILSGIPGLINASVGSILGILISGPLMLGLAGCFVRLARGHHFKIEDLFDGFKNFATSMLVRLITTIIIAVLSILLIIPGIIVAYSYALVFFILYDNPEMKSMEILKKSSRMMKGNKWKLFSLHLSFIGWIVLSTLTLGIGFLFLFPYMYTATANFYENLKDNYKEENMIPEKTTA